MKHLILSILTLVLGAFISLAVKERFKVKFCTILTFISAILAIVPAGYILKHGQVFQNGLLTLDPLSAIFVIVISFVCFLGTVYANGYLKPYLNKEKAISSHCFFFMMLIASMLAVVTINNGLYFLIAWEIMSLSSFFLVIFEGDKKSVLKAGIKYLIYMHLSVIFLIAMFAILSNATGSLAFSDYAKILSENPQIANIAFLLGFIGFSIKAGFVPFHNWLPDAHPAAPTHVSGLMSGVMIKMGIYGVLRLLYFIVTPSKTISYTVLAIAVISALYGVLYAITQKDIKRLLACSSIENIAIIGIGIGVGMLGLAYNNTLVATFGLTGAILHFINHAIFKNLLFFSVGSVYLKTHTRDTELLGGLIKSMPYTALMFIVGSVAICGLPPFNGFISEILIYAGMLLGLPNADIGLFISLIISVASLALIGTMAILCFSKAGGITFLGNARSEKASNVKNDVGLTMKIPMGILAGLTLLIGFFPQFAIATAIIPASMFINNPNFIEEIGAILGFAQYLSGFFVIFALILACVLGLRFVISRKSKLHNTWGCGYNKPNSQMQYTASSYANLFVSTVEPLFKKVSHIKKPKDFFPKEAYYELEMEDIEEAYIVKPILDMDEKLLSKFERIQNGNMQQYILFGLVFLIISIIGLVLIG